MNDIGEPTVKWLQQHLLYGHRGDALMPSKTPGHREMPIITRLLSLLSFSV
jgi:hypothetical protein